MSAFQIEGPPAQGGGSPWELAVDESGASFGNFTASNGSWSASGGEILVSPSTTVTRAYLTAEQEISVCIFEAQVKMNSTGSHAGTNRIGVMFGWDGTTGSHGGLFALNSSGLTPSSNGGDYTEWDGGVSTGPATATRFDLDTFYTLRIVLSGPVATCYRDATRLFTFVASYATGVSLKIGLYAYNCDAAFKNIKLYNISGVA